MCPYINETIKSVVVRHFFQSLKSDLNLQVGQIYFLKKNLLKLKVA